MGIRMALTRYLNDPSVSWDYIQIHISYHLVKELLELLYSQSWEKPYINCHIGIIFFNFQLNTHGDMQK